MDVFLVPINAKLIGADEADLRLLTWLRAAYNVEVHQSVEAHAKPNGPTPQFYSNRENKSSRQGKMGGGELS